MARYKITKDGKVTPDPYGPYVSHEDARKAIESAYNLGVQQGKKEARSAMQGM